MINTLNLRSYLQDMDEDGGATLGNNKAGVTWTNLTTIIKAKWSE